MHDGVALSADAQAPEVVKPGEGSLDDPAPAPESRAVRIAAPGDYGLDASAPELTSVLVVVIAAVGDGAVGTLARSPTTAAHAADALYQRRELGDVVAVCARQRHRQGDAVSVDDQVVL
jgi:hypothetical protein